MIGILLFMFMCHESFTKQKYCRTVYSAWHVMTVIGAYAIDRQCVHSGDIKFWGGWHQVVARYGCILTRSSKGMWLYLAGPSSCSP